MVGLCGVISLEKIKVGFDLKFGKLQYDNWDRNNMQNLARELYEHQGEYRIDYSNRLFILFDESPSSSVPFLKRNEPIMLQKVIEMSKNPEKYWFNITVRGKKLLSCIILIPKTEYKVFDQGQHRIRTGMSEPEKAEFAHQFLKHMNWVTDGIIIPHDNPKERGLDGFIFLSETLVKNLESD